MSDKQAEFTLPIPYPSHPLLKWSFKSPILLYRLGLGNVVGRLFMILTTRGRKTGLPRHTAIEFHRVKGRPFVVSAWGENAQWYRNILADPRVTIQTDRGAQSMIARRVTGDEELLEAFQLLRYNPIMQRWVEALGYPLTAESFLEHRDSIWLITFDSTQEETPAPLCADLAWVWVLLPALIGILWWQRTARRRRTAR